MQRLVTYWYFCALNLPSLSRDFHLLCTCAGVEVSHQPNNNTFLNSSLQKWTLPEHQQTLGAKGMHLEWLTS
ncbi:hypothetical protein M758_UG230000 [Ceratodon purpureus]|nr:hypothetical protein M758_UG230000 [Ceratodon purpureus]